MVQYTWLGLHQTTWQTQLYSCIVANQVIFIIPQGLFLDIIHTAVCFTGILNRFRHTKVCVGMLGNFNAVYISCQKSSFKSRTVTLKSLYMFPLQCIVHHSQPQTAGFFHLHCLFMYPSGEVNSAHLHLYLMESALCFQQTAAIYAMPLCTKNHIKIFIMCLNEAQTTSEAMLYSI